MVVSITPSIYVAKEQIGDFAWMIQQDQYAHSLFIFNDVIERIDSYKRGNGNAWIRARTSNNPEIMYPQAANIPVASIRTGGFLTLSSVKENIDMYIDKIRTLISTYSYDNIYFAVLSDNKIATNNYTVAPQIRDYITSAINNLN